MSLRRGRVRVVSFDARSELAWFVGCGVLMMLVVGLGAAFVGGFVAQEQALEDAGRRADRLSALVIGPLLPGYLSKDPATTAALKRAVSDRVGDGSLNEVTIWTGDGRVLYSDRPQNIGKRFPPSEAVTAAIGGTTTAAWEDDPPEADATSAADAQASTADDRGPRRYVEVYAPLTLAGRPPMAFEAYFNYRQVNDLADRLLRRLLPLVLVPLLLLLLIQVLVGVSLSRRIRRWEDERLSLLQRAVMMADRERARLAAELHDGPIQELAGTSYALGAVASTVVPRHQSLVGRAQGGLQGSIHSLRGLMTRLDPPDLRSGRLDHTVIVLAERLREEGVDVEVDLAELPALGEEALTALYRVVRETLANAHKHAAGRVTIALSAVDSAGSGEPLRVRLVISDDGSGIAPSRLNRRSKGHLRMRLLHHRVTSLGGELEVTSALGQGTTVRAELPARAGTGH
jgi:two-component system NarL family sensor kinase